MLRKVSLSTLIAALAALVFAVAANGARPALPGNIGQQAVSPAQSGAHDQAMADLMARLQGPIVKLQPGATIGFVNGDSGDTLRAQFQTQQFLVYSRGMTGEIYPKPINELGPNYKGFLLEIHTESATTPEQLVPDQTLHEPYWDMFYSYYEMKHPHRNLVINLSYGVRTNPKLIAQIKQIIADYAAKQ